MPSSEARRKPPSALLASLPCVVLMLLCPLRPARADVVLLIEEPINVLAHIASTGHSSLLLTGVCSDDRLHVRACRAGEAGTVISRYQSLTGKYDWLAMSPSAYLYAEDAPVNPADPVDPADLPSSIDQPEAAALRARYAQAHPFAVDPQPDTGNWLQMTGQSYRRRILCLRVRTTPQQDERLIGWLTQDRNRARYNFLFSNCADFARRALNVLFPGAIHRNLFFDAGMTTPKELAAGLHHYAARHPELDFTVEVIPQVPGSIRRSGTVKGVTESFVKTTPFLMPLVYLDPLPFGAVIASGLLDHRYNPQKAAETAPQFNTRSLFTAPLTAAGLR